MSATTITLYNGSTVLGSTTVLGGGIWSVRPALPLADAAYNLTATQTDAAHSVSALSTPLVVTIETVAPTPGVLVLAPASDSGVKLDSITNVTDPVITGTGGHRRQHRVVG